MPRYIDTSIDVEHYCNKCHGLKLMCRKHHCPEQKKNYYFCPDCLKEMWGDKYEIIFLSKAKEPEEEKNTKPSIRDICSDDMAKNLRICATLRGVPSLQYRTLREFAWFVDVIIYKEFRKEEFKEISPVNLDIWERLNARCPGLNTTDSLVNFSKLFLEYCLAAYGEEYLEERKELDGLISVLEKV